ncbi:uncharacterized protein LOC125041651 [Penaeus chinensis]|uniref:uncharacterized protein LOC125041651 n=1 Tax=Penaeus chinensis TaxID=139456 RepID=UPI001FB65DF5|nr:uncharacterized protein LOC125041651 [Penaeus chinensis]
MAVVLYSSPPSSRASASRRSCGATGASVANTIIPSKCSIHHPQAVLLLECLEDYYCEKKLLTANLILCPFLVVYRTSEAVLVFWCFDFVNGEAHLPQRAAIFVHLFLRWPYALGVCRQSSAGRAMASGQRSQIVTW